MSEQAAEDEEGQEVCPICGAPLIYQGGCKTCSNPECGWGACG